MQFQSQNLIFVDVVTFFLLFAFFIDCNCTKNKSQADNFTFDIIFTPSSANIKNAHLNIL